MTLNAHDTALLTKLLGLLSSAHAGERAAAGAKADELLRKNGMRWADVLSQRPPAPRPREPGPRTITEQCDWCLKASGAINAWERKFLLSIRDRWDHSEKQLAVLNTILAKVRAFRAATKAEV